MTTGERLIELRNKLGFSQEQMADELGVKRSTYAKWEKDTNQPTRKLKDIAAYFHVTTDYLLGNTDIPNEPPASAAAGVQTLTPQDQELLRKYHILTDEHKGLLNGQLDAMYNLDKPKVKDAAM